MGEDDGMNDWVRGCFGEAGSFFCRYDIFDFSEITVPLLWRFCLYEACIYMNSFLFICAITIS